ncbi:MerR family transcriptional regulator [Prescottella sp. R16]|uniref:MerR family transcriptional regulator n=1 Tax=Prescottella sp. R16 TaxID=3064529 RepID=UPI00272DF008|nr:MerR family transcriptional regulator [Prescottella sp. R16]
MEWTVKELAERAGISGRTLRHYHDIGLLEPDRVGSNGYRYYGPDAVTRLHRILLLRDTGMALGEIAAVLDAPEATTAEIEALQAHLRQLVADREALDRRIDTVEHTLAMRRQGREPQMDVMLQGFNDRYEDEVVQRWGREAFEVSNRWWHSKSVRRQREWKDAAEALLARWRELQEEGCDPDSAAAQEHAAVHLAWFADIPGTPTHAGDAERSTAMVLGVAAKYETDPDFHRAFGSRAAARFAATALRIHVQHPS